LQLTLALSKILGAKATNRAESNCNTGQRSGAPGWRMHHGKELLAS